MRPWRIIVAVTLVLTLVNGTIAQEGAGDDEQPEIDDGAPGGWVTTKLAPGDTVHPNLEKRLEQAQPLERVRLIVQYGSREAIDHSLIERLGGSVHYEVNAIPALFVSAPARSIHAIAEAEGVYRVHHDDPIEYDLESAVITGRAYHLWGAGTNNVTLAEGPVTGHGIGVAVVDTGVNAVHADLQMGKVTVRNLEAIGLGAAGLESDVLETRWEDNYHTDANGHGSHVAGTVAGSGELSGGKYVGSAPGASIYGFGSNVASLWYAVLAWDWVHENGADQDPPIRIITNSWGTGHGPCELDHPLTQIQEKLVLEKEILMIFSSGNTGRDGDGTENMGRTQYQCPWQGNIGVASMDDRGQRDRDGPPSVFTARGAKDDPTTWPHISAPGSNITAPNGGTQGWGTQCSLLPHAGLDTSGCYRTLSGTSMSTPFVAGVAALILQARSDLRPADVQYILQQTAYKFGDNVTYHEDPDGDYRYDGGHHYRGHGLVDAEAAVAFALTYEPADHPVVHGFDETPAPLWQFGLAANQTDDGPGIEESGQGVVAFITTTVVVTVVLIRPRRN